MIEQLRLLKGDIYKTLINEQDIFLNTKKYPSFRILETLKLIKTYDETPNYFCIDEFGEFIYDIKAKSDDSFCTAYLSIKKEKYNEVVEKIVDWIKKTQIEENNSLIPRILVKCSNISVQISFKSKETLDKFIMYVNDNLLNELDIPNILLPSINGIMIAPDANYIDYAIKIIIKYIEEKNEVNINDLCDYILNEDGKTEYKEILVNKLKDVPDKEIIDSIMGENQKISKKYRK